MHNRQLTHFSAVQSITPLSPFLASAPDGQFITQIGSAHCRQSASSKPSPAAAGMMPGCAECAISSAPDFACAQAITQSPQPSQRLARNCKVLKQTPIALS